MPELPEVETTRRGLSPHLLQQAVSQVVIRQPKLRWPIPSEQLQQLIGQRIQHLQRRAKYLLIGFDRGTLIIHLGMSGSLRILPSNTPAEKHDHFDLVMSNQTLMRLRDPRRFGAVLWHSGDISQHPLLINAGPEPVALEALAYEGEFFNAQQLYQACRRRSQAIKLTIMNNKVVVGVGNIYANEALFRSGISPLRASNKLTRKHCEKLTTEIQHTLLQAIEQGGSSLRDFVHADGNPGYFQQNYWVYGLTHQPCQRCQTPIKQIKQGQRSSFYCPECQR